LAHDLLYAFRTFRRAPAFALTAIVTFALGIGATTAMFSTVNAVEDHFGCAAVSVPERDEQQREQQRAIREPILRSYYVHDRLPWARGCGRSKRFQPRWRPRDGHGILP